MSNVAPALTINGREFKTPVLLVSPEDEYVAIFQIGGDVAILKSQAGSCVVSYPVRHQAVTDPANRERQRFESLGYVRQTLPREDFLGFLEKFMSVAGFTFEQVTKTFQLGTPRMSAASS